MLKPKQNRKKLVRISGEMGEKIVKMKENNFTLREIGGALGLTHTAVLYFLRKAGGKKPQKLKITNQKQQ